MKKLMLAGLLTIVLGFSSHANAALQNLGCGLMVGTTCQGNLIYDDLADVTWFDYTYKGPCPKVYDGATFDEADKWVQGLTVAGVTGWKLPKMDLPSDCVNLNDLTCAASNFTCPACRPPYPAAQAILDTNVPGFLFWISFGGSTARGTDSFTSMDIGSGKHYWTSSLLLGTYHIAFSFSDGKIPLTQVTGAYAMAMKYGKIQPPLVQTVAKVQTSLTDFRSLITDEEDAAILEAAIKHYANTQNPAFWKPTTTEDNQVQYILNPATGKEAFREAKLAVQCLNVLIVRGYAVQGFVDDILYAARWMAQNAIIDAKNADSKPQNIEKGMNEMGKAAEAALERYGLAWEAATKTAK